MTTITIVARSDDSIDLIVDGDAVHAFGYMDGDDGYDAPYVYRHLAYYDDEAGRRPEKEAAIEKFLRTCGWLGPSDPLTWGD